MTRKSLMDFTTRSIYSLLLQVYGFAAIEKMGVQVDFDKLREVITYTNDDGNMVHPSFWEYAGSFARHHSEYKSATIFSY